MEQKVMIFMFLVFFVVSPICALPRAPALYVFGDSLVDGGNNNFLPTFARANFLPYGIDFPHGSTGRFTNGKTFADFIAEYLGLPYPPPYLSPRSLNSLIGINYASGSCGILPETGAMLGRCLNLRDQVNLFQNTVKNDLPSMIQNSTQLYEQISKSIFVFSIGSNDYINNYIQIKNDATSKSYEPIPFAELLITTISEQFEKLYKLGARKIIMSEIGPVGCIPSISRTHKHEGACVEEVNKMVAKFNERLPSLLKNLTSTLPNSSFILCHSNFLGYDIIKNPSKYGLSDASNPCCTTIANGTRGCIPFSTPCLNRSKNIFWDAFHLTESVYSIISSQCISNKLVCTPLTIEELSKYEK